MNYDKLETAMDAVEDKYLAEAGAAGTLKKRRPYWLGAVAAALAIVIFLTSGGLAPAVSAAGLIAAPEYPEMAPYPSDWFADDDSYSNWRNSLRQQYDQPAGYADGLEDYFQSITATLLRGSGEENAVCSPVNVYMALAMLAQCAGGNSRQQILDLLGADSIESLRTQAGFVWNAHYRADGMATSLLANSLWLDEGIPYDPGTVSTLADSYYASVYQGELGSDEMNESLRSWLNEQTGGLLEDQISGLALDPETILALASTIYYKARWSCGFDPSLNTEDIFHSPAGEQTVTFLHQSEESYYFWGEDYGAVRLDLDDGSAMWLILPDEGKTVDEVLTAGEAMDMVLAGFSGWESVTRCTVNLSLPKFDVSGDMELTEDLRALGITDIFSNTADFSAILPGAADVFVSSVRHASRVVIDEEGIEAAAYTVIAAATSAIPMDSLDEIDFILDRPFLFVITSQDDLPLFAGVVNEP